MPRRSWIDRHALAITSTAAGVLVAAILSTRRKASAAPVPAPHSPPSTPPRILMVTTPTLQPFGLTASTGALDYERTVVDAATRGIVPSRQGFVPVTVSEGGRTGTFWASKLPLTVGTDDAPLHAALSAPDAQRIADHFGYLMPTRKMVDAIHQSATVRVPFQSHGSPRQAVSTYLDVSASIAQRIAGRDGLVGDYAKDYVLTNARRQNPARIAIYGAWQGGGAPVQPFAVPHALTYYDYSQHPRFVLNRAIVDGREMTMIDALTNSATASLFSDEGPLSAAMLRY